MILTDLLIGLRQRLVDSVELRDSETLKLLAITFGILRETSYPYAPEHPQLITVLSDLEYSAQHGAMEFWNQTKDIPSVETIIASLAINDE